MIQAKCIEKIRNKNNVIEKYTLQDKTGETITVTSKQLKEAIRSGKIEIVNLQLTANGRLMDKNIEDTIKSYSIMNKESENSKNQYNKALMLGVAPVLDVSGCVVGINGKRAVFSDETSKFARNIVAEESTVIFNGSKELTKTIRHIPIVLVFGEVIINNPCVMTNIGANDNGTVRLLSTDITIRHNYIDIKTVDEIFRILKNQYNYDYITCVFKIKIDLEVAGLTTDEVYDRAFKILKRQKAAGNTGRRAYDLIIYLQFIYSMWLSTNKDKRYIDLAQMYIEELYTLKRYVEFDSDKYSRAASRIINMCLEEIVREIK